MRALAALFTLVAACAAVHPPSESSSTSAPAAGLDLSAVASPSVADASVDEGPVPSPAVTDAAVPLPSSAPLSAPLRNPQLHSPLPGGSVGGWLGDTGVDISARFRPVYALAAGTLDYSERGHTLWKYGKDTPNSVRIALDEPIDWKGHKVTHVYYTHLSALEVDQPEGSSPRTHVVAGQKIGVSGVANGVPHLHIGLLLDDRVEQDTWDSLLTPPEVQSLMGNYKNGEVLP